MRFLSVCFVVISLSAVLLVSGCGSGGSGGDSSSETTTITGTLSGGGFAQNNWFNHFITSAYAAGGNPDKIVAVAKDGTIVDDYEISSSGEFEINVDDLESQKVTLFVKNSISNEVTGHIKMGNKDDSETLDIIDGASIREDMHLGTMNVDELTCPSIEDTGAFTAEDIEFFKDLANNDDVLASFQNKLTNSGIESYLAVVFNLGSVESVTNNYFDITTFSKATNFKGMMPLFYYYGDEATDLETVTLFPPAHILHSDPNDTENDTTCDTDADTSTGIDKAVSYNNFVNLVTIETAYVDTLPEGDWVLKNADSGSVLGQFVFSESKPFRANNRFKTFVPIPRINTVENNVISVTLKFNRFDNSGAKPTNKHFFDMLSRDLTVSYVLDDSNTSHNMTILQAEDGDFELQCEPDELIDIDHLDKMIISYKIGGVKYQFFIES